jgi:hypothetical protein
VRHIDGKMSKLPFPENIMGTSAIPVGGGTDFVTTSESDDYDLPFKVWGFYDVRGCEYDETLPNARRATQGVIIRDGKVEDWIIDDWEPRPPVAAATNDDPLF